jgi:DNA-binding GntR family transcriptional regulator
MRVIAPRASDALITRLDQNLAEQKLALERANAALFSQIDLAFHEIVLSELGYDRVRSVLESARGSLNRTRMFLLRTPERQAETHREHVAIVEALRKRDPIAARRAMAAHLDRSLDEIEIGAAENPEVFALAPAPPPV